MSDTTNDTANATAMMCYACDAAATGGTFRSGGAPRRRGEPCYPCRGTGVITPADAGEADTLRAELADARAMLAQERKNGRADLDAVRKDLADVRRVLAAEQERARGFLVERDEARKAASAPAPKGHNLTDEIERGE